MLEAGGEIDIHAFGGRHRTQTVEAADKDGQPVKSMTYCDKK
jgi:hypothetical protein